MRWRLNAPELKVLRGMLRQHVVADQHGRLRTEDAANILLRAQGADVGGKRVRHSLAPVRAQWAVWARYLSFRALVLLREDPH